jgi:hypothetical protein
VFRILFVFGVIAAVASCSREAVPDNYDDCVLQGLKRGLSEAAIGALKTSCKAKYPKTFDFDLMANKAEVKTWRTVVARPEFTTLSEEDRAAVRKQYLQEVIEPRVPPDFVNDAAIQFDAHARRVERAASHLGSPASAASGASSPR